MSRVIWMRPLVTDRDVATLQAADSLTVNLITTSTSTTWYYTLLPVAAICIYSAVSLLEMSAWPTSRTPRGRGPTFTTATVDQAKWSASRALFIPRGKGDFPCTRQELGWIWELSRTWQPRDKSPSFSLNQTPVFSYLIVCEAFVFPLPFLSVFLTRTSSAYSS